MNKQVVALTEHKPHIQVRPVKVIVWYFSNSSFANDAWHVATQFCKERMGAKPCTHIKVKSDGPTKSFRQDIVDDLSSESGNAPTITSEHGLPPVLPGKAPWQRWMLAIHVSEHQDVQDTSNETWIPIWKQLHRPFLSIFTLANHTKLVLTSKHRGCTFLDNARLMEKKKEFFCQSVWGHFKPRIAAPSLQTLKIC